MEKFLFNATLFTSALLLMVGIFRSSIPITAISLVLAVISQHFFRKKYPRKTRSYREIIAAKQKKG
ncbi:hypothetical protein [Listeria seeligeri]|uniref:Uncharacterized protein n=1 Tax=Listeria seeligeri TaxID=1640 RepID=A0A7X1C5X4_LISSE|nr:hypothetical protein [Listeria seeligeri]MBC1423127.1 hypothetical protein [Listeria seeligeri]MBC1429418.1 hypothetical protein [Listeria seeligeri]MBC1442338.1 hypothetical protein [Listeria seeligeri]MBC1471436.1 hypothetical protein [Listeria seeligeri]MBC1481606.1 hypothetical protein [Listeria seeligeri]